MRKKLSISILLLFLLSVFSVSMAGVSAVESPAIMVLPENTVTTDLTVGMLYTVAVYTDYDGWDVTSYQFTLSYDPAILEGFEVADGDLIVGGSARFKAGPFDNVAGKLSLTVGFYFEEGEVTAGPGTLAYVTFRVVSTGTSSITLGEETKLIGWDLWEWKEYYIPVGLRQGFFDNTGAKANPPYLPVAVITAEPDAYTNEPATFSGVGSYDPDGTSIVGYLWDLGDETAGTGLTIDHIYTTVGIYTVTLRVSDAQGQVSDPATHSITIKERAPYDADLVKWKAKPEAHSWDYSKDEDKLVTLTALARNFGSKSVNVQVTFAIIDASSGTSAGPDIVATATLPYGPEVDVPINTNFDPYLYGYTGTKKILYTHVTLKYDSNGDETPDTDASTKIVRFAIVP